MERRDFFKLVSTASTGLVTGACGKRGEQLIPLLVSDREIVPGEEQWRPGVCQECGAGCGIIARVMQGERIIERNGERLREAIACIKKIEGNPLDPVSGGRLCARGQSAVQGLYNPDRLRGPMRRVGPKGKAEFAPTSWDEAIAVAVEKLTRVVESDPSRVVFLTGPQPGTRAVAIARFMQALGAPPPVTFEIADFPLERKAAEQVFGWTGLPVYDLARARYVIGVGADFLGGWASPVFYGRQFGHFRQGRPDVRGRLVQAQSRLSVTAASADEWLPLRPGTEVFFIAAVACLVLEEKLARRPESAPPAVIEAFKALDLAGAIRQCGVEERRLRKVAHELGESEAPLVIAGTSEVHTNSLAALVAAGYLNRILGNVGKPGGVLPPAPEPTRSRPGFSNVATQLERAQFVFVDGVNPAYTLPAATRIADHLARVDTLVSFAPFLNDTSAYADLLLPDHHALEAGAAVIPEVALGPAVTLATPFVRPLYETRPTEQILAEMAKKLEIEFEPVNPKTALAAVLPPDLSWDDAVRQGGIWADAAPVPPAAKMPEPALELSAPIFTGDESRFPLHFQPYLSLQFGDGRSANLPWMQELPDPASSAMWGLPVEIDPKTASKLQIKNGDLVRVESEHGSIDAPAYVHPAAVPGVASMGIGEGHRHYGRYAGRGVNPVAILAPIWEKVTGALALGATRVRISRLEPRRHIIQFSHNDREHGPFGHR